MSQDYTNEEFIFRLSHLSEAEMTDPYCTLTAFVSDYDLSEVRQILNFILETCMTTERFPFAKVEGRSDLLLFYKRIDLLFEAIFLLVGKGKRKMKHLKIIPEAID